MTVTGANKNVRVKTSQMIVATKFFIIGATRGFEVKLIFSSILYTPASAGLFVLPNLILVP
jgi:hypothetical protein